MKRTSLLLLAALMMAAAPLVSAKNTSDSPASIPVLLGLEPVRQDLKLSSLQCALLDSLRVEYKAKAHRIVALGFADQKEVPRATHDLEALRNHYNERALNVLNLSQQERLRQIEHQMLGGVLLTSLSEQKLLGLTPKQQETIAKIHVASLKKVSAINTQFRNGKISSFRKVIELHRNQKATSKRMLAVLTPEQKKQFLSLSGVKIALPLSKVS